MKRLILISGFFLFVFSATICYAANIKPCVSTKTDAKQPVSKSAVKSFTDRLPKAKATLPKTVDKHNSTNSAPAIKNISSADTFESLIAPFLKMVSPHFYDQIIKRDTKQPSVLQT